MLLLPPSSPPAGSLKKERETLIQRVKDLQGQVDREMGTLKKQVVASSAIESTYAKLVREVELFLTELKEREQAQIEEEKEVRKGTDTGIGMGVYIPTQLGLGIGIHNELGVGTRVRVLVLCCVWFVGLGCQ